MHLGFPSRISGSELALAVGKDGREMLRFGDLQALAGLCEPRGALRPATSALLELHRRGRVDRGACSGWQLLRENVDGMDLGAPVEQFLGPAEQGGGDGALKVRLAGLIAAEAVKDSERPLIDPEGVPGNRSGLLGNETEGACKKRGDLLFLPRLCLQTDG